MFLSSYGGIIEDLLRNDYELDFAIGYGFLFTLFEICKASIAMMFIPLLCRVIKGKRLAHKTGKRICLWNSIILFILSSVLMAFGDFGFIGGIGAVFFYFINKWTYVEPLLLSNDKIIEENVSCTNEELPVEKDLEDIQQNLDLDIDEMSPQEAAEYLVAEQLGEKYIPKENQSIDKKIKYCRLCGSKIDSHTKKCTGCGKQYFKGLKFTKFSAIVIALILVIATVSTMCILQFADNQKLKDEIRDLKNQVDTKQSTINSLESSVDELSRDMWDYRLDAIFVKQHVVFVEDDGTNLYHSLDCDEFKRESFWVYNVLTAVDYGYRPCPICC